MRRILGGITLIAVIVAIPALILAKSKSRESCDHSAASAEACASGASAAKAAATGKLTGKFDPAMSGVCRFGCATKVAHEPKDVIQQPGAKADKLTQCPVSGVVFAVEEWRPRVSIAGDEYVTCCDKCATKLKKNTKRYLRA